MDVVGDRFELLSLAGQGGMGRVFRAKDLRDGKIVALKLLHVVEADAITRFRREIAALAKLDHPGIVRYVADGTAEGGVPFLVMDWVEGEELRTRLKRDGCLEVSEVVALAARLAEALAHAHELGVMHRDIKPSNIVLPTSNLGDALVIDFGLARTNDDELTRTGMLVGTPVYMAPEQIRDSRVSASVDVFSLGCVMYQCLAQTTPFAANGVTAVLARVLFDEPVPVERIVPTTPQRLAALVGAMLSKSAADRPSMRDVVRALGELDHAPAIVGEAQRAPRLSTAEQRVVSVIVAGVSATPDASDTLRHAEGSVAADELARVRAIAERFGAELTLLPNGALVALLAAQSAATDLAARAADCALELKSALGAVPVGLATGRAQTGEGIPIGEAIDRAVAFVPFLGDAVQIDDVTAGLLATRFDAQHGPAGIFLRRGTQRAEPVRTLLGKPTPCVGRDAELATLEGLVLQSASESVARAVLVTAPAGAGKSRVRQELVLRLRARGDAAVWIGRGDSVGVGAPFGMLAQIIRREARILDDEPAEESRSKLLARTGRVLPRADARRVAMFLGELVGVRFEDDDVQLRAARSDPRLMGDQTQRAFLDFVEAECRTRPVVVVLEDLQWGDQPTVATMDAALRVLEERPLTVVAFARSEVSDIFPELWAKRRLQPLPLVPLPKKAAARLVRAVLAESTPESVVTALVEKAAGNVFFLEELLRSEAEGRGGEVPLTVVAMVQTRLGALEPEARRVLRAASVLGDAFVGGAVQALLGNDGADAKRWLDGLVEAEVLTTRTGTRVSEGVEYAFRHALVREGAYAMLTDADRALGHRLAAQWLERRGDASALLVAAHYERAGDAARAATSYLRAAEQALESSDLVGAIDHAEQGIVLGAEDELLGALRYVQAQAHQWRGETEAMEAAALQSVSLLPEDDARWADAMTMVAVAKQRLGNRGDLASVAERLLAMLAADGGNRAELARAGGRLASLLFFAGKQDAASTMLDAAERAARDGGADVDARIHQARAPHARQAGRPAAALMHAQAAEASFRTAGDLRNACLMQGIRGFALSELGAYGEAETVLHAALTTAERLGLTSVAATARANLGIVFLRLGRASEGEATVRAAVAAFESNDRRHEGGSRAYLALILRDAGALADAEQEARRAFELLEAAPALRPFAGAVLATVLLAAGDAQGALAVARDAMRWVEAGGNVEEGDALLRLTLARALFATGTTDEARRVIAIARDRLLARAATIEVAELRQTFLTSIPEHAMTLELATGG